MKSNKSLPLTLLITDPHLHKNNVELVKDIFDQAIEICKEKGIDEISHLGDFFTSREAQPLLVLKEAKDIFSKMQEANISISIIPGNHDKVDLEDESSYIGVVEKGLSAKVISNEKYDPCECGDINIYYLPYFKEKGSYMARLEYIVNKLNPNKKNILLTHIAVNGVQNNDGSTQVNDIKQELFSKFYKVFTGHFHDRQSAGNIHYIGSSHQNNFGEDDQKGFTILYDDGSHEFIQSNFPKYIKEKIDIDDKKSLKEFEKKYANSTDHVRVILTGDKTKLQSFRKDTLIEKGIDCKFESEDINNNFDISKQEIVMFDRSNIKEAFDKFCEINSIEDKDFGLQLLEKIL